MLQRPSACDFEMYLSSRSPPDHLLYQMLKTVPVWAGIAPPLKVAGSTCARAGRRFFLADFLGFVVSAVEGMLASSGGGETPESSIGGEFGSCAVVDSTVSVLVTSSVSGATP